MASWFNPLSVGQPLHTLVVSYLHPCEAALAVRLVPGTRAPHAESDRGRYLIFWLHDQEVLWEEVHGVEDANFILVAAAANGNLSSMRLALDRGATLLAQAARAAAQMGEEKCLRFAVESAPKSSWTGQEGRDIYLAAQSSKNENGSIQCLKYLDDNKSMTISSYADYAAQRDAYVANKTLSWSEILNRGFPISFRRINFNILEDKLVAAATSGSVIKFDRMYLYFMMINNLLNDETYASILEAAAFHGNLAILQRLRHYDQRLRHYDSNFRNPGYVSYGFVASVAALKGHYECAKWALKVAGPLANHYENRIFQHAAEVGSIECMQLAMSSALNNATPLHVGDWFIIAPSPLALESIHRLASERLEFKHYACAMWHAVRYRPDNIPVLAQWIDTKDTGLADVLLQVAAKFNRLRAMSLLKNVGARNYIAALKGAGTEAASLLSTWINSSPPPTPKRAKHTKSQLIRFPRNFWQYGYM
jgi:hypothetical protein